MDGTSVASNFVDDLFGDDGHDDEQIQEASMSQNGTAPFQRPRLNKTTAHKRS